MGVTTKKIWQLVDGFAPFALAEEWDNSGLQVGDMNWPVQRVLVALDVSLEVMAGAVQWGADLVLTHHPLMMAPPKNVDFGRMPGRVLCASATEKISIISAHTNLDKAEKGLNDFFAGIIGLEGCTPFLPHWFPGETTETRAGLGRQGRFSSPLVLGDLAEFIKEKLSCTYLRITGDEEQIIRSAVVCTGSGASLTEKFLESGQDLFITGDMKYHEAREIEQAGRALMDVGHFASEHIAVRLMVEQLKAAAEEAGILLEVKGFDKETDPFTTL
ncbi:MAG TPA: Nif3-like dinuclear metal center hexameric protein [Desulfobacteraceae bacterium]|nr:Nif3-like dinuclear metal center hexameric protein [Desulfobacteraceae bacterium]